MHANYILDFSLIRDSDTTSLGETAAQIGEMTNSDIPVPDGFIIPAYAYFQAIKNNNLSLKIQQILSHTDYRYPESVNHAHEDIKKYFNQLVYTDEFIKTIHSAYKKLGGVLSSPKITLLPSYTSQNVKKAESSVVAAGDADLLVKLKKIWATNFDPESLMFQSRNKTNHFNSGISVIVQKYIKPESSGYLYTRDPETNDPNKILIQAKRGSSENKNSGSDEYDRYVVSKNDLLIAKKELGKKQTVFLNHDIIALAKIGKKLEKHFYFPKVSSWVFKDGKFYITTCKNLDIDHSIHKIAIKDKTNHSIISKVPNSHTSIISKTATKVYQDLSNTLESEDIINIQADGVGILNANIIFKKIGTHPSVLIKTSRKIDIIKKIVLYLEPILNSNNPNPVIYCLSDLTTNDLIKLRSGKYHTPPEPNPLLGYHGAYRHIHDTALLKIELEAISYLRNKYGYRNLHLMVPFIRNVSELVEIKKILGALNLHRSASFKLWMMVSTPSNVVLLDKFCDTGIDGLSINLECLAMLTLGIDKENSDTAPLYNETDESVIKSVEKIIKTANNYNIPSVIFGHSLSIPHHQQIIEKLVSWGITGVSVKPDSVDMTRQIIAKAEQKIILPIRYV